MIPLMKSRCLVGKGVFSPGLVSVLPATLEVVELAPFEIEPGWGLRAEGSVPTSGFRFTVFVPGRKGIPRCADSRRLNQQKSKQGFLTEKPFDTGRTIPKPYSLKRTKPNCPNTPHLFGVHSSPAVLGS